MKIAFDFDYTICVGQDPNEVIVELIHRNLAAGHLCSVITSRNPEHEKREWWSVYEPDRVLVEPFLKAQGIDVPVFYTNHAPKSSFMRLTRTYRLYDNDESELRTVRQLGMQAVHVNRSLQTALDGLCGVCGQELHTGGVYVENGRSSCSICKFLL